MYGVVAQAIGADWPIIGDIARFMGWLLNQVFDGLSAVGVENIGITIIVFTIIIQTAMIPLTIKQQKGMRMQAVVQPEIQKIQKKYAGKTDQASRMKMTEETQLVYKKYGTSMVGGCLPMLVQMPILMALFPVLRDIPRYVEGVRQRYSDLVSNIYGNSYAENIVRSMGQEFQFPINEENYESTSEFIYAVVSRFQEADWTEFLGRVPAEISVIANETWENVSQLNNFIGINMSDTPFNMFMAATSPLHIGTMLLAVMIPVLSGASQFVSVKLNPQAAASSDNPMAKNMKAMTNFMPLFSVFIGFSFPAGLGLYWTVSSILRAKQQYIINKSLNKKPIEELIEENVKKHEKKLAKKKGGDGSAINKMATASTRSIDESKSENVESAPAPEYKAGGGSLADKANLVSRYNANLPTSSEDKKEAKKRKKK